MKLNYIRRLSLNRGAFTESPSSNANTPWLKITIIGYISKLFLTEVLSSLT